ncbi:MAG: GNAT family N-acetyltransferase [Ferrovum myxofaciens]|uniref:GNAT family N-acetyltransferase n=1 Tax=Ferrovum myxofaciens TaxID=416213 RepID=UPI002355FE82|nr:GNAT family N-acetyltransferase [Ferrovum myxofaciens]QKE41775.1 MAG: GNAT family N-acetyltransferase [Ferrovum myxofaciens]
MNSWTLYPASRFGDFQNAWQHLNQEGKNSALLDPAFLAPALQLFGTGKEQLAILGGSTPSAMALLRPTGVRGWETFQPSQCPLGFWVCHPSLPWQAVFPSLLQSLPGFPVVVGITQQDPDIFPRPSTSRTLKTLDYIQTARITLQGTFDAYWQARGKNLRANMKKQRNSLTKLGLTPRLEILTQAQDMDQAVRDFGQLESTGWKNDQGTAIHRENPQGQFYTRILENFCTQGKGRVYRYWFDDVVTAMDLCIADESSLIILKTAYNEQASHGTSPAFLMHQESFQHLFEENTLSRIEFYGKVLEWHTRWTDEIRTLYHVNGYRWGFLPGLLGKA